MGIRIEIPVACELLDVLDGGEFHVLTCQTGRGSRDVVPLAFQIAHLKGGCELEVVEKSLSH